MTANSRSISTNQTGPHASLSINLERHLNARYCKPIAQYNQQAFSASIAIWQDSGKPLILDSGCGVGLSTLHLAARHPDHFVIGVDQSADRLARQSIWNAPRPENFTLVRADLVDYWCLLLEAGIHPERHYLLYPNPWPKKRHLSRRWHGHPIFPAMVALGGHFECRSNWGVYIEECALVLRHMGVPAVTIDSHPDLDGSDWGEPITPFEKKYLSSGQTLWRCRTWLPPRASPGAPFMLR